MADQTPQDHVRVMLDPEGHLFCLFPDEKTGAFLAVNRAARFPVLRKSELTMGMGTRPKRVDAARFVR